MNWNKNRSIFLSKICVLGFGFLSLLLSFLVHIYEPLIIKDFIFYLVLFLSNLIVFISLRLLYKLLSNIQESKVFIDDNVRNLRALSWCCFAAAFLFLIYYWQYHIFFLLIAMGAGFMGLIIRIIKNVFVEAIEIKQENDYTI